MGECKFLLKTHAGISFLENQLRTALTFDFDKIVVVCSPERSEDVKRIISSLHSERILFVLNDQAGSERFYSIQCGLKLLKDHDQCFIQNTDCPELIIKTLQLLLNSRNSADTIIPIHFQKGGHPVLINKKMIDQLIKAPTDSRLDIELKKHTMHRINVNDPCIHLDIDTPGDYIKYLSNKAG
ncbi:MAG: NTP transferase domain-containing protein [Sphingobacteriaceae bacterium]|nr:NTP transferase domain-containing protein [Sphingobacteriaceae bacterium]